MRRLFSEPLIQFLLLGALIFAADVYLNGPEAEDSNTIRVTQQHLDALRAAFQSEKSRQPSEAELQLRLQQWLDEQMLYLEARKLGLDKRDSIVRRQMVQKMRFLMTDAEPIPEPGETELQAFLNANAERYGHSPRLSFDQVFLSRGKQGERMGDAVRLILGKLEANPQEFLNLGDSFPAGQSLQGLSESQIQREFGKGFYQRLVTLPDKSWQGPIASSLGLHMIRISQRHDFRPAVLSEVRKRVENDWRVLQREQANARAMQKIRERFEIEYEMPVAVGAG